MSNETKRDVFDEALDDWQEDFISDLPLDGSFEGWSKKLAEYSARYSAALPDDLPVIPEAVGGWLKNCKHDECDLVDAIVSSVNSIITSRRVTRWMEDHFETFASAWLLGVWRVEETGEIVKLEA
ncbi:DUF1642 domain-containing protein [Lacticaseibacillus paracasei]|uniref:DUF1642 domain-containing protein n=1 Tax=Lacticaseibacillus paracasei TaxID=1597 RepID=UPI0031E901AA